jgi:RNA polymerase sigma-70 factor, ECF subfamily
VHPPVVTNGVVQRALADDVVVGRAANGDERAFAALVQAHHASMTRVAYVITGNADGAADAVQSAWTVAWRKLDTLRDRSSVRSWLVAIAANEARLIVRRNRYRTVRELAVSFDASASDPGAQIALVDLRRAMQGLSPDDRTLLALRFVAGLDSNEIAIHLRLSASGVRSRLSRLLERLRLELDHE